MPSSPPVFVQSNSSIDLTSTATISCAFTNAQPAHNCIVVSIQFSGTVPDISSVTDSSFNTYSIACPEISEPLYSYCHAVYVAKDIVAHASGNIVLVTLANARTNKSVQILEYSGARLSNALDGSSQTDATLGDNQLNPTPPNVTTTRSNDTIVTFLNISQFASPVTVTIPTGYTSRSITTAGSGLGSKTENIADGPAVTVGVYAAKWTLQGNRANIVAQLFLTPTDVVPTITFLAANFIGSNQSTLNALVTSIGTSPIISYGFHYGLTSSYGSTVSTSGALLTSVFSKIVTGLTPSTSYHFQAFATNNTGEGVSLDSVFKTSAVVSHADVTGINSTGSEFFNLSLNFQDEFDSPISLYDSTLNVGTWRTWFYYGNQTNPGARGENLVSCIFSDQAYNGINPFSIAGSNVTITADINPNAGILPGNDGLPFTSGTLTTQNSFSQTYGYFECRCRTTPMGVGIWPAFWMMTSNIPSHDARLEMDIMEDFADPSNVQGHLHYLLSSPATHLSTGNESVTDTTQFHIYGMLWTPGYCYFYIDDVQKSFLVNPGFNQPEYVIATFQTGAVGSFLGYPTPGEIPASFIIDYIRTYSIDVAVTLSLQSIPSLELFPSFLTSTAGGVWDDPIVTWEDALNYWDELSAGPPQGIVIVMGNASLQLSGVPTISSFGTPIIQAPSVIISSGIISREVLGSITLLAPIVMPMSGIPSGQSFGIPAIFLVNIGTPVHMARCL